MGLLENIFSAAFWREDMPSDSDWVEWKHISRGLTHCEVCLKLNQCWFIDGNKPILPQHLYCHCTVVPIPLSRVLHESAAECDIRKFNEYVLHPDKNEGKKALFDAWGYKIMDSEWLQKEFKEQAFDKYIQGQYTLGKLNEHGQRINIRINLKRKDNSEMISFVSGWMVYPTGIIRLTTPYGGK